MNISSADKIALYGSIADLKEDCYRNLLVILSLIQELEEKGLIDADQLRTRARALDKAGDPTLLGRS